LLRGQIESETFDRAALTEILRQRRSSVFISGEKLDMRLVCMLLTKQKMISAIEFLHNAERDLAKYFFSFLKGNLGLKK
jgi:hypothetical protein